MCNGDTVSIILPIYNGSGWIKQCFESILKQTLPPGINLEICVCDDGSVDDTGEKLHKWHTIFMSKGIEMKIHNNKTSRGVGYSKNRAVDLSIGKYICFQDIDDIMISDRIKEQFSEAKKLPNNTLIGCRFKRVPEDSTRRFTKWANTLSSAQLDKQIYTSHGPTIIMPTWFCHRSVFDRVGGFSEEGRGIPEDLIFFYKHLNLGGKIHRVDKCLLLYTYHPTATTFSINESTIWKIRIERLQNNVLCNWNSFTIWNAGKQGRKFYRSLQAQNQNKVTAFCDVDVNKIGKNYVSYDSSGRKSGKSIPIVHFKAAKPPFIICVKLDLTNGEFEENLESLQLIENIHYIMFN